MSSSNSRTNEKFKGRKGSFLGRTSFRSQSKGSPFVLRGSKPVYSKNLTAAMVKRMVENKAQSLVKLSKKREENSKVRECEDKFKQAMIDPFNPYALGCCLPAGFQRPSFKFSATASGTFSTSGADGYGWIFCAPTPANNKYSVYTTKVETVDAVTPSPVAGATGAYRVGVQSPFPAETFTDGSHTLANSLSARVISVGLRIRYIGTKDQSGGRVYGFVDPSHQNLCNSQSTIFSIANRAQCIKYANPGSGRWMSIKAHATSQGEIDYPQEQTGGTTGDENQVRLCYPWSNDKVIGDSLPTDGAAPIGMWVKSANGRAAEYEFEVIYHCEGVGEAVSQMVTQNYVSTRPVLREGQQAAQEANQHQQRGEQTAGM